MDPIPFEKVSLEEAKAALDGNPALAPSSSVKNWVLLREAIGPNNSEITEQAWQWLDRLPKEIQPGGLVQRFPRITNKLAELWSKPLYCEKYLDALMLDHRGSRKGFPPDVAKEIADLKIHFMNHVLVRHFGAWGERIGG